MTIAESSRAERDGPRFRAFGRSRVHRLPQLSRLSRDRLLELEVASAVLPFRVNDYVLNELIDWSDIPCDPIYQLTFPHAAMLDRRDFRRLQDLLTAGAGSEVVRHAARRIQMRMHPHPAGQMELNVPVLKGMRLPGCQHKYRETVLFFPRAGQTCHAYCTYCFRWAQFVGVEDLKFAMHEVELLVGYLRAHREVTNVLVTGGDPMVMSSALLRKNIEPLLGDGLEHVTSIRIGTKALSYWPYRFTSDRDSEDLLRLFEDVRSSGRQLAVMAHFSHPRELQTRVVQEALRRVRDAGAVVRCQSPLIRHVNDDAEVWADLWREEVRLGLVPYYQFVARNTGPRSYFEVPLANCLRIFSDAFSRVSGLARTVRGPVMSATPGKVLVVGVDIINGQKVFVLKMIQGRDPEWVNRIFFARFDPTATWLDDLEPAFGARRFFFDGAYHETTLKRWMSDWIEPGAALRIGWRFAEIRDGASAVAGKQGPDHQLLDSVHHPGRKRRFGPGVHVSDLLVERGVSVVLTGRCDPKTFEQLASAGLWVVTGCDGNVRQVLERFTAEINGQLTYDTGYSSADGKNLDDLAQEPRTIVRGEGRRGRRRERRLAHGHEAGGGGPWYQGTLGRF